MKAHGAYASTFSDWWSYKAEVEDAIPYNLALMTKVGVVVAVNSDDAEQARHLNQEAAKGIKYGGLTERQAAAGNNLIHRITRAFEAGALDMQVSAHTDQTTH